MGVGAKVNVPGAACPAPDTVARPALDKPAHSLAAHFLNNFPDPHHVSSRPRASSHMVYCTVRAPAPTVPRRPPNPRWNEGKPNARQPRPAALEEVPDVLRQSLSSSARRDHLALLPQPAPPPVVQSAPSFPSCTCPLRFVPTRPCCRVAPSPLHTPPSRRPAQSPRRANRIPPFSLPALPDIAARPVPPSSTPLHLPYAPLPEQSPPPARTSLPYITPAPPSTAPPPFPQPTTTLPPHPHPTMSPLPALLASALLLSAAAAAPDVHVLPSGRRIPLSVIRSHPFSDPSVAPSRQLYELTSTGHLSGGLHDTLALHNPTTSRSLAYHPKLRVTLNGRLLTKPLPPATLHTGPGFSAVYAAGDHLPSAISLGQRDLVPLHFADHPGVYIASSSSPARSAARAATHVDPSEAGDIAAAQPTARDHQAEDEVHELPAETEEGTDDMAGDPLVSGAPKNASTATRLVHAEHTSNVQLTTLSRQRRACGAGDPKRFYEVAAAFDNTLCARYGNQYLRAITGIQTTMNAANGAFWTDLCVRIALVHVEAHCQNANDPYARTRGQALVNVVRNFRSVWRAGRNWLQRDVALLFVGYTSPVYLTSSYRDSSCSKARGYAVTERVERRLIANAIAFTIGGRAVSYGLLGPYGASTPLRPVAITRQRLRNYLEFNGNSWCIDRNRRFCSASCGGRCVAGKCVTGSVVVARARRCAATIPSGRPVACELALGRQTYITPWLDALGIVASVQYGNIVVRVQVVVGAVALQIGFRVGAIPTRYSSPALTTRVGNVATFRTAVGGLPTAAGQSCCWKRIYFSLRIYGCLSGNCGTVRKSYYFTLRCRQVCFGRGTPLAMASFRRCPRCSL